MRTAVYTRISQDAAGERLGVTRQLDDCLALADRLGWTVVDRFDDNDISAFNGKTRPGFEAMLEAMRRAEVDALVCWHPDRLYRTLKDLVRLLEVAAGVEIRTVNGGDMDLSTSTGRMLATILGSVAAQESEHKGERQKRANVQRAAAGTWNKAGQRPFGYTKTGELLEPEASALQAAVAAVLAGTSLRSIAIAWNKRGLTTTRGNKWTNLQLRRTLANPLNAGLVVYNGKTVGSGEWEPLLDVDTHHGLVAFLSDPSRKPGSAFLRKHMGSGVYRCGRCGQAMYAGYPHGPGRRMTYLCRPTSHVARLGEPLDEYVETLVLRHLSEPETQQRLTVLLDGNTVDVDGLHTRRSALQARLDELAAMFAEGAIDASQLRRGTSDLRTQLAGVDKVLAELSRKSPVADLIAAGDQLETHWAALSPDMRGKVVNELMTVTVQPGRRGARAFDYNLIGIDWRDAAK